jgi:hypothetical protein
MFLNCICYLLDLLLYFAFHFVFQLPGYDLTKVESMMGEVESHYFPIGQSQSHSSPSHQNAASKELVALLWRMLVLVENRAASSELWAMLQSSSFCEGIEASFDSC